jgi:hypothetical protein
MSRVPGWVAETLAAMGRNQNDGVRASVVAQTDVSA